MEFSVYVMKEKRATFTSVVFSVLIYMEEFIKAMDHISYSLKISGLFDIFSRGLWKTASNAPNESPSNKAYHKLNVILPELNI